MVVLLVGCLLGGGVAWLTTDREPAAAPPGPTSQPGPVPTTPAPGPTGQPVGEELTGQGPRIVALDLPADALHTITLSYRGEGFFAARLVDDDGEFLNSLGSGGSPFDGTWPVELGASEPPAAVDISDAGDGTWTLLVQDLAESPEWPTETEGSGTSVLRVAPGSTEAGMVLSATHDGERNFIVHAYYGDEPLDYHGLWNEIGEFSGSANNELEGTEIAIYVQADGDWTITPP